MRQLEEIATDLHALHDRAARAPESLLRHYPDPHTRVTPRRVRRVRPGTG